MNMRWILVVCCAIVISILEANKLNGKKVYRPQKPTKKAPKYPAKLLPNSLSANSLTSTSNLKLDELIVPIKKLTRRRMIKLLIKSVKRVNKNAKKLNKSDNKSIEFRPKIDESTRRGLQNEYKDLQTSESDSQFKHVKSNDQQAANNRINFEIKDKNELIKINSPSIGTKFRIGNRQQIELNSPTQYTHQTVQGDNRAANPMFLRSINQVSTSLPLFNTDLLTNTRPANDQRLESTLHHLQNLQDHPNGQAQDNIYLNKFDISRPKSALEYAIKDARLNEITENGLTKSDQLTRIPSDWFDHFPIFVNDQFNSSNTQLIRNYVKSQLDRFTARSDQNLKRDLLPSKLFKFIASQLDIDTDRADGESLEITKLLGAFVGDIVGVVIEEILHKRGDKIADGIRTKIEHLASSLINKSNLTLEMAVRSLSKLMVKKRL